MSSGRLQSEFEHQHIKYFYANIFMFNI